MSAPFHVAAGTVTRYARALEQAGRLDTPAAFDRTKVEAATRARAKDNAARRADLEAEFLQVAAEELARRDAPVTWGNFGGKDNTYEEVELPRPTFGMRGTLVTTAARATKAALDLAAAARDTGTERAGTLLDQIATGGIEVVDEAGQVVDVISATERDEGQP